MPDNVLCEASNLPGAATPFDLSASGNTGFLSLTEVFAAGDIEDGGTVPYVAASVDAWAETMSVNPLWP